MGYFKGSEHWIIDGGKAEQKAARQDMAVSIVRRLFGQNDWQGVQEKVYAPAGLLSEIRKAIKSNQNFINTWVVGEDVISPVNAYTQGESAYYIVKF